MDNIYKQNKLCELTPKECIGQPRGCYYCHRLRNGKRSHEIPAEPPKAKDEKAV